MKHKAARFSGYAEWQKRKTAWVRDAQAQLDEQTFRTIAAGTGLPPIHQKSTFPFKDVKDGAERFLGMSKNGERPYARIYTRLGNPTTEYLERVLFQLEAHHVIQKALDADEKTPTIGCLIFGSGMGAISTFLLSVLSSGDTVLLGNVYGCTDSLVRGLSKFGIHARFVDMADLKAVERELSTGDVACVVVETPENPTLQLCDIEAISKLTDAAGAWFVVDNTFCSPYLQQPFRLGADIVVHSITKFINGHSTSIAGALLGPFQLLKEVVFPWYKDIGATPSPFDAWLNSMTVQSLAVRQDTQSASALKIANFLQTHPEVAHVAYPGLANFPQRALCEKQMRNGGSVLAFEVKGGVEAGKRVMNYFGKKDTPMELAVSLGSAVSYIQHPASMTHAVVPEEERLKRGITPGLIRLSVGLEGEDQLMHHLDTALRLG